MKGIILIIIGIILTFCWLVNNALKSSANAEKHQQQLKKLTNHVEQLAQEIQYLKKYSHNQAENNSMIDNTQHDDQDDDIDTESIKSQSLRNDQQASQDQLSSFDNNYTNHAENLADHQHASKEITEPSTTKPTEPNDLEKAFNKAKTFLTTGNLPVKVGMIAIFASVIAFLRYVSTIVDVPIQAKLLTIVALALGALVFAWSKRNVKPRFSLVVQGGSIGIILLTIFAAVRMYPLISAEFGFVISVIMIAITAILAIKQDANILGITAVFAGFLAPIWLSNGTGSHVVLFSYYAVLNLGVLVMTRYKPWYEMSIEGFVATYVLGSIWGGLKYQPENFSTIEPFIILFFLFYLYIPLHHSLGAEKAQNHNHAEQQTFYNRYRLRAVVIFGTPTVTFFAHSQILTTDTQLAISCVITGGIYGLLALALRGSNSIMLASLQRSYAGIAITLLTLAIPIGLSAKATTTVYALEGAAAIWLGLRPYKNERSTLTWTGGILLQLLAMGAFFNAYNTALSTHINTHLLIFNELYLSGFVLVVSCALSCWFCFQTVKQTPKTFLELYNTPVALSTLSTDKTLTISAQFLFITTMVWWLGINIFEINRVAAGGNNMYVHIGSIMLTCAILPLVYHYKHGYKDNIVWLFSLILISTGAGFAIFFVVTLHLTSISIISVATWILYAIVGLWLWRSYRTINSKLMNTVVIIWLLSLLGVFTMIIFDKYATNITHSVWKLVISLSLFISVLLVDIVRPQALRTLIQGRKPHQLDHLHSHWQVVISSIAIAIISSSTVYLFYTSGDTSQGIWIPIFNAVDIVQTGFSILLVLWIKGNIAQQGTRGGLLHVKPALLFLIIILISLVNIITLRCIYHNQLIFNNNYNIAWGLGMFGEAVVQMSLTLVWSILGVITWIVGSKYRSKIIWLLGAILMVTVLVKLMLVDRTHLGNLFGIGSFFAYGLLCVIVGYFAPIPQSDEEQEDNPRES